MCYIESEIDTKGSKITHKISRDLLISVAEEKSRHAPPSQESFQKSTIEKYILHNGGNCISTVLYCVVIHMRSKVYSLCVECYISGIL